MSSKEIIKNGICYMCGLSCPINIHIKNGRATKIQMVSSGLANACPRGKTQLDFIYHADRLTHPLKRTAERGSGIFKRITWDEALDITAESLQKVKKQYGAEAVAFWVAYTKEPRPYFHRLTHAFGSPNYITESSSCATAAMVAASLTYGTGFAPFIIPASPASLKCRIIWGTSILNSNPQSWQEHVDALKQGIKLIVIDPRLTKIASMADVHLQLRPGTDGALALCMMNVIIHEDLYDKQFVNQWTIGFNDLCRLVKKYTPEYTEKITWVPAAKIKEAAILFATQKPAQIIGSANSTTHHTNGVQNQRAIILLPAITGNVRVPGSNRQGHVLPPLNDITLHDLIEKMPPGIGSNRFPIWTQQMREMQSNALADQIESSQPYPIKALLAAGLDLQFFPNSRRMAANLKKLDFIAVTEYFRTASTDLADIVLPIASWLERQILIPGNGMGNPELIRLIEPAIAPVGESWTEWKIYYELAKRLGFGDQFWDGDFEKCADYILAPAGLNCEYLKQYPQGVQYRSPGKKTKTAKPGFKTPSGKIEIFSSILAQHGLDPLPVYQEPPESPLSCPEVAENYPLVLTSGARVPAYVHSQYRNIARLRRLMPEPLLDIHPLDAARRGIHNGESIIISSRRGSVRMKANVTDTILPGLVSAPHHWPGDANINMLVDDVSLDPISGFPPFKSQLCQVSKD